MANDIRRNKAILIAQPSSDSIVVYQSSDGVVQLDVQLADETVWLTQKQMAWLLDTRPQNITMHIGNIDKEEALEQDATCKDFLPVQTEGGRTVRRMVKRGQKVTASISIAPAFTCKKNRIG